MKPLLTTATPQGVDETIASATATPQGVDETPINQGHTTGGG